MDFVQVGGASIWFIGYILGLMRVRDRALVRKDPKWREMLAVLVTAWGLPFGLVLVGGVAMGTRQPRDAALIAAALFFWEGHSAVYGDDGPSARMRIMRVVMWLLTITVGAALVVAVVTAD